MSVDERTKPSMAVPKDEWAQTDVHQHSTYSCGKCGEDFGSPDEVYAHLDKHHSRKDDGMRLTGRSRQVKGEAKRTRRKAA